MGSEVKCGEVKWTDLKRDDKTSESVRNWKMGIEVKWLEVKCGEVKWKDLKRDDKTSESGRNWKMWSEVKCGEVVMSVLLQITILHLIYITLFTHCVDYCYY